MRYGVAVDIYIFSASVNFTLMTELLQTDTVILRCSSNNGNGTWFVFKGPSHEVLFKDAAIGSGYNKSKFQFERLSSESIDIKIHRFDTNDIDVYLCSHKDKSSKPLDLREMKLIRCMY